MGEGGGEGRAAMVVKKEKQETLLFLILPAFVFVLASTRQVVNGEERAVGVMEAV